jgi:hypothetical protein
MAPMLRFCLGKLGSPNRCINPPRLMWWLNDLVQLEFTIQRLQRNRSNRVFVSYRVASTTTNRYFHLGNYG